MLPFANHNFINIFTNERDDPSEAARAWLRKKGFLDQQIRGRTEAGGLDKIASVFSGSMFRSMRCPA